MLRPSLAASADFAGLLCSLCVRTCSYLQRPTLTCATIKNSSAEFLSRLSAPASGNGLAEAGRTRQGSPLRFDERAPDARP